MGTGNGSSSAKSEVETRQLPVKLTEQELLKVADDLAAAELKIEELKVERSQLTADINAQVKERNLKAHTIDRGTEDRDVKCTWAEDFHKNVKRLKRNDTGEEVDTRPMTAADRTQSLFAANDNDGLGEPPPRAPKKKRASAKKGKAELAVV